jgi:uncharacterized protein (TIGR02246 family)
MPTTSIENEIVDLEKQYWQALKDKNAEAALRLTDDGCILTGAQGAMRIDPKQFETLVKTAPYTIHSFEIEGEPLVNVLSDDVVIVAYQVTEKMTVEGKPVTLKAADATTWVRRNGRWRAALHTESILGDSFGRDRGAKT